MKRREFIALLGGAAAGWPCALIAQTAERPHRIGVLMNRAESDPIAKLYTKAFVRQLKDLGWTDGQNVRLEYRFAEADPNRVWTYATELVQLQPDLILGDTTPATAALLRQTQTIPVVFVNVSDPLASGFVGSLAQPGGNVTGFTNIESSMATKCLELLKEIAPPRITRAAFISLTRKRPRVADPIFCARLKLLPLLSG